MPIILTGSKFEENSKKNRFTSQKLKPTDCGIGHNQWLDQFDVNFTFRKAFEACEVHNVNLVLSDFEFDLA